VWSLFDRGVSRAMELPDRTLAVLSILPRGICRIKIRPMSSHGLAGAILGPTICAGQTNSVADFHTCLAVRAGGTAGSLGWPENLEIQQMVLSPEGTLHAASSSGIRPLKAGAWQPVQIPNEGGRVWAVGDVPRITFNSKGQSWFEFAVPMCQRNNQFSLLIVVVNHAVDEQG
jgi:hypothetical protein